MFTQDNTAGYSNDELAALNEELAARLAAVEDGPHADDERADIEKSFSHAVACR